MSNYCGIPQSIFIVNLLIKGKRVLPHRPDTNNTDIHLAHRIDGIADIGNFLLVEQRVHREAEHGRSKPG